jgi:hypothetical protein
MPTGINPNTYLKKMNQGVVDFKKSKKGAIVGSAISNRVFE